LNAYPYQIKSMVGAYGKQITTARRLARYRKMLRAAGSQDELSISREAKRRDLVHRITAEIIENLLTTESDTPVARELIDQLSEEFGHPLVFAYPPEEQELQIFKLVPGDRGDKAEELGPEEKGAVFERLWRLALEKVDDTML